MAGQIKSIKEITCEWNEEFEHMNNSLFYGKEKLTGAQEIDFIISGFRKGDLVVILSEENTISTDLMINMFSSITESGIAALFISYILKETELLTGIILRQTNIKTTGFNSGLLKIEEQRLLHKKSDDLAHEATVFLKTETNTDVFQISDIIAQMISENGIEYVFIDGLAMIDSLDYRLDKNCEIAEILKVLKTMALKQKIPMIIASPSIYFESGNTASYADMIICARKNTETDEKYYEEKVVEINIRKNRRRDSGNHAYLKID